MLLNTTAEAQFDSIIFARNDIYYRESVVYLGDQNDDGCDDFLLCTYYAQNGLSGEALLFYGGNPINPVPAMAFKFVGAVSYSVTACDYNRDGYRDIFVTTYRSKPLKFKIFLGGPALDTIPDMEFTVTNSSIGTLYSLGSNWPLDLNGDGYEEFVAYSFEMYEQKGAVLIYNSGNKMDSIPDGILTYAPDEQISLDQITHGDLDGDGRTDLTFIILKPSIPVWADYRRFVFGRSDFSFEDTINFIDSVDIVRTNRIIQDINKDGRADLAINDTKFIYPYWYRLAISYGSRTVNHLPEEGFNTQNEGWLYSRSLGDVNGDGYGDFLTCLNYYGARLFLGGKHKPDDTPIKYYSGPTNMIERVGDVNGDGLDDIGLGTNGEVGATPGTFYIMSGERVAMAIENDEAEKIENEEFILKAYPNPTRGEMTVEITGNYSGYAELRLYNTTGKELIKKGIRVTAGITTEKIDLRELNISSGVYIMEMLLETTDSGIKNGGKIERPERRNITKIVLTK